MEELYYAACVQTDFPCPTDRAGIAERVTRMCQLVEYTVVGYEPFFDVRLFVFPEFAHAAPIFESVDKLRERLAVPIPNEHTDRYVALARKLGVHLQTGTFLEVDPAYPEAVFNTTCLIGPTGILSKYRKTNPWIPWEIHASPHDIADYPHDPFPVVDTPLGKLGVAICYDWLFPEAIRQLAANGAEVLLRVSAYMDPWGVASPMEWWTMVNRVRALENMAYVVAANQGANLRNYPPFSWPGGSMIIDYDGRVLAQADAGPGEKVVVAPIALGTLRAERRRRAGHAMLPHLRHGLYPYTKEPYLAPAATHPITGVDINARIAAAKAAEKWGENETRGQSDLGESS